MATNIKYILQFRTFKTGITYKLLIIDVLNQYNESNYPKYLTGSRSPIIKAYNNTGDNPYSPIIASQLKISIILRGEFSVNDFSQATDRQFKVELYKDGALDFQGWLLSTEIQKSYTDAPTNYLITAVDGLSTLKGKLFKKLLPIDSGLNFAISDLPFYGLYKMLDFIHYCLFRLDYDYGVTTLFASLRFVDNGNSSQPIDWTKVLMWSDQFFDDSGTPMACYDVLESILKSFGLQIFQIKGEFVISHVNDLFYINSTTKLDLFLSSSVKVSRAFDNVTPNGFLPTIMDIGYDNEAKPVNTNHSETFDVAYSQIKGQVTFRTSAYIYPDPGFEQAPTGGLPLGFIKHNNVNAVIVTNFDAAYEGTNFLNISGTAKDVAPGEIQRFIDNAGGDGLGFLIESNKLINMSFVFKSYYVNDKYNTVPRFSLLYFIDGLTYIYDYDLSETWKQTDAADSFYTVNQRITDYIGYNQFGLTTTPTPGNGIGRLYVRLYSPTFSNGGLQDQEFDPNQNLTIDIDQLQITATDSSQPYSKLVGETHLITNKTNFALSEDLETDFKNYTVPDKRLTGSVLYGTDYINSVTDRKMWLFKLSYDYLVDGFRLTEAVVNQYEKNYQRPMMMWNGDVFTDDFSFFRIVRLRFFENKKFSILNSSHDLRQSIVTVKIRELNDTFTDYTYKYIPKFEKYARKVSN